MNQFNTTYFLFGCLGGLLPNILRVIKNMYSDEFENYWSNFHFWLGLFFLFGLGGFVAWIANASSVVEAVAYGFSSPEILMKIMTFNNNENKNNKFNIEVPEEIKTNSVRIPAKPSVLAEDLRKYSNEIPNIPIVERESQINTQIPQGNLQPEFINTKGEFKIRDWWAS